MSFSVLESWAVGRVVVLMGGSLGKEDVVQLVALAASMESKEETASYFQDLLGQTPEALDFIQQFLLKRFPPLQTKGAWTETATTTRRQQQQQAAQQALQQQQQQQQQQMDAVQGFGYVAESPLVDSRNAQQQQQRPSPQVSQRQAKKKAKQRSAMEQVGKAPPGFGGRPVCECMAEVHGLLTNCLKCGKIICEFEAEGPCSCCGNLVISREQQLGYLAQRAAEQLVPNGADGTDADAAFAAALAAADDPETAKAFAKAEERKARLLEYDRNSTARTHVHDTASDFDLASDAANKWLTPEERALAVKKMQEEERLAEQKKQRRVITIDLENRRVVVDKDPDSRFKPKSAAAATTASPRPDAQPSWGTGGGNTDADRLGAAGRVDDGTGNDTSASLGPDESRPFRNLTLRSSQPTFVPRKKPEETAKPVAGDGKTAKQSRSRPTPTQSISRKALLRLQDDYNDAAYRQDFSSPSAEADHAEFDEPACG
ncbi:hypothetical protein BC831DRAFT_549589 [Entophlyctis helioformis]|nr:hypothetical protein BC831DRAFT_549589 [Entophlyctis helioformis]